MFATQNQNCERSDQPKTQAGNCFVVNLNDDDQTLVDFLAGRCARSSDFVWRCLSTLLVKTAPGDPTI